MGGADTVTGADGTWVWIWVGARRSGAGAAVDVDATAAGLAVRVFLAVVGGLDAVAVTAVVHVCD